VIPHLGLSEYLVGYAAFTLYILTLPIFILSISWKPLIGLLYMVPLLPLQSIRFHMHAYPLGKSFVDIILLGVLIGLISRQQLSGLSNPLSRILWVLAIFTYFSLWKACVFDGLPIPLWVNDERVSHWKNDVIVPVMIFVCVLASIRTVKDMKLLLLVMCLSMGIMNRQLYGSARQHQYEKFDYDQRAEGFNNGMGSNELGALEAQFCLFLLGLRAFEKRRILRWAYLGLALLSGYCVMVSFSRGAYIALLMGWLFLGIVKERVLGLTLLGFLFTWQAIVPNAVKDRVFMTYDSEKGELESSASTRVTLWEDAFEAFTQEPIFGKGYNTYRFLGRMGGWRDSHNFYVKLIFELGVVGFTIYLTMFWKLYSVGYRLFRSAKDPFLASLGLGLASWMVCSVFANIFGDRWNFVQITGYMFAIAGCVVRGLIMTEQQKSEEAVPVSEPVYA
jgi:putative inorganic carbon (HCO3(-)) transporter